LLKRKRAIDKLHLTPLPTITKPRPPLILAIDINVPDNFRTTTPEAEDHRTPIDDNITDRDYLSTINTRHPQILLLPEETAPWSYRPLP